MIKEYSDLTGWEYFLLYIEYWIFPTHAVFAKCQRSINAFPGKNKDFILLKQLKTLSGSLLIIFAQNRLLKKSLYVSIWAPNTMQNLQKEKWTSSKKSISKARQIRRADKRADPLHRTLLTTNRGPIKVKKKTLKFVIFIELLIYLNS